ncbi:aminopeptidase P family protein [Rhizobium sp. C4]|uniref:aminopeptidase P family protein n=1 Tax=Rhizobium sp. C4 TaxID=1349800 RepID=UPI001E390BB0|nr:aminopeptidase P family protein [Rhizobium sp. C4]MCD2173130.1 aminopeptidase P family protein [Rhizobium sp. C4]
MFQSFETTASPANGAPRVRALREHLASLGVDGFLVPRADEFQGEYVPASAERLSWLTGFTGSAGAALVAPGIAVVFVDGRYVTQLAQQTDPAVFTPGDLIKEPPADWIANNAGQGFRLGIDPWLHTVSEVRKLKTALESKGGALVLLADNPLDTLWTDRPAEPLGRVTIQKHQHSGTLARDKIAAIAEGLRVRGADAVLIADPSSVAWAFNIRGSDVPHTPHPLARAIIHADGLAEIFLDARKTGIEEKAYLTQICEIREPAELAETLGALGARGATVEVDAGIVSYELVRLIEAAGGTVCEATDPCALPRATKNEAELAGTRTAHVQDGVAMVEFLAWLDDAEPGAITEIKAVERLEACRRRVGERMQNPLADISFDTISGAGPNGAIIHYRVTGETNRQLAPGELFLVDSGGQYRNGTTDITRTVAIGAVGETEKRFFTLVLKGMIGISTARFPAGSRGVDLDPLARIALWKAGADYGHGTGHGVGSYLSVHEGPQRISRAAMQELLPGMILSNEPGYYRPGAFGIRIENLIVVEAATDIAGGDRPMLGFETITWCPIDRRLILPALMTREELDWLNAYHASTREKLMPLIEDEKVRGWLARATAPIA